MGADQGASEEAVHYQKSGGCTKCGGWGHGFSDIDWWARGSRGAGVLTSIASVKGVSIRPAAGSSYFSCLSKKSNQKNHTPMSHPLRGSPALLGFEGVGTQAIPGPSTDAPHPCGAPSGCFPRSLRYSVRHRGEGQHRFEWHRGNVDIGSFMDRRASPGSAGGPASYRETQGPEAQYSPHADRRGLDVCPYGSPSTGVLRGKSPSGAPQGRGASIVRPRTACRSTPRNAPAHRAPRRGETSGCRFFGYFLWTSKESNSSPAQRGSKRI